jgi:septal ring factor EnvC (AmiA/AmiB activator)
MLETFHEQLVIAYRNNEQIAEKMLVQYEKIYEILKNHLDEKQMAFIPTVEPQYTQNIFAEKRLLMELISATSIAISYLRSLDSNVDKELQEKQKELEFQKKQNETMQKFLKDSIEAIKEIPEVLRSEAVEKWKKSHREIEKSTKNVQET